MQKYILIVIATLLSGCASKHMTGTPIQRVPASFVTGTKHEQAHMPPQQVMQRQKLSSEQNKTPPLANIPIDANCTLHTTNIWPLKNTGSFLQQFTVRANGKKRSFSLHVTIEPHKLEAIAYNDMVGRLYTLVWAPDNLLWEGSTHIPEMIKPENIVLDFLLTHLPANDLQRGLQGAFVYERNDNNTKERIIKSQETLRTITYKHPFGNNFGFLLIDNPKVGYKLEIKTQGI